MDYKRGMIVTVIISTLIVVLLSFSLLTSALSTDAKKLKILLPTASEHIIYAYYTHLLLANENGFFDEEGLDVEVVMYQDATGVPALVSSDSEFPIGVMNIESMFQNPENAQNLIPFDFFLYGEPYDTHLVVSKKSGIETVSDLKGKKIRVGLPPTFIALKNILNEADLKIDDVVMIRARSTDVLDQIRSGQIDAAITYYPTMPVIIASGEVNVLKENIFNNYVQHHVPSAFIGVNKDFAENDPKTIKSFLSAMEKAYEYGAQNPDERIRTYENLRSWIVDDDLREKLPSLIPEIPIRELDENIYMPKLEKSESVYQHIVEYQSIYHEEGFIDSEQDLQVLYDNYIAFMNS